MLHQLCEVPFSTQIYFMDRSKYPHSFNISTDTNLCDDVTYGQSMKACVVHVSDRAGPVNCISISWITIVFEQYSKIMQQTNKLNKNVDLSWTAHSKFKWWLNKWCWTLNCISRFMWPCLIANTVLFCPCRFCCVKGKLTFALCSSCALCLKNTLICVDIKPQLSILQHPATLTDSCSGLFSLSSAHSTTGFFFCRGTLTPLTYSNTSYINPPTARMSHI